MEAGEKLRCLQETDPGPDAFIFWYLFDSEEKPIQPELQTS
jgi:hypothetical protein